MRRLEGLIYGKIDDEVDHRSGRKVGALFSDTLKGLHRLNDRPLEYWVDDFKCKVEANQNNRSYVSFQELSDSIDWRVEFE